MLARLATFAGTLALAALLLPLATPHAVAATGCDRFASVAGNDAGVGTAAAPYRTVQKLVTTLAGGGTGCLAAGTYYGNVIVSAGGSADRRLVVTTTPGAPPATVKGIVEIRDTANHVTFDGLRLDGSGPPTPNGTQVMIFGDHVTLSNNEITSGGERICVSTGDSNGNYGIAWHTVIERNRIHDCGNKLTGSPSYPSGHALYLQADRYVRVANNVIYDMNYGGTTGGRGIQLWPDSQYATIENNIVDNANQWSIIVSGGASPTGSTRGTKVRNNIFSNPVEHNVTSAWWGVEPQGGVEVTDNCVHGAPGGNFAFQIWLGKHSYDVARNVQADPLYVDRAGKDFRLRSGSPCAGKGPLASPAPAVAVPAAPGTSSAPAAGGAAAGGTSSGPGTTAPTPAPPVAASAVQAPPSVAAPPTVSPRYRLALDFRSFIRGRVVPGSGTRTPQSPRSSLRVVVRRLVGSRWRVFSHAQPDATGAFAVRRGLWSKTPRLTFRAELVGANGVRARSKPIVLRSTGGSRSIFHRVR